MTDSNTVTIGIAGFTYYEDVDNPSGGDPIRVARLAVRDQEIELSDSDLARAKQFGAIKSEDEPDSAPVEFNVVDASDDELADYLETESPNVGDTVDLAEGDPENARRLLKAEDAATGGDPRQGVVDGLTRIVEG